MAVVIMLGVLAACSPQPGAPVFPGGTYDLDLSLPPQHLSETFPVANLGTCTVTVDSPEIRLDGATLTAGEGVVDQVDGTITVPDAKIVVPHSTIQLGSVALECFGNPVGSLSVAVEIEATASVQSAVFDAGERTLTLTQPTISIPTAKLIVTGSGTTLPPFSLPPIDITVPTISTRI
ncbi:hypothetical protein [Dermatobacter hominis]|uniref:hypothetical protein n=1 Tax=Dermatobacter hominis TaxID=2884263 RepID=UPI001D11E9BF|nr:hypothetical protein [Dermatobacter hominis]UDY37538.1 hypothetical protein LH044_08355 [Dermatobacter hominis]